MPKYMYDGPVYRGGKKEEDSVQMFTDAPSIEKAWSNFSFRVGKNREIVYSYVHEVGPTWEEENPDRVCPDCGNHLQDSGECPLCTASDYSIYDEIKLMKDIDDGNYDIV